jgi:hypothetical protein
MSTFLAILLALWSTRHGEEPTRLECLRRLVAADEPKIRPIARGRR